MVSEIPVISYQIRYGISRHKDSREETAVGYIPQPGLEQRMKRNHILQILSLAKQGYG